MITLGGHDFRDYDSGADHCRTVVPYHGASWQLFQCNPGDHPVGDHANVDRDRLNGVTWKEGVEAVMEFSIRPMQNFDALTTTDWFSFVEIHASPAPGDIEQSGPFGLYSEWSAGEHRCVTRAHVKRAILNDSGHVIDEQDVVVSKDLGMTNGNVYTFKIEMKQSGGPDGYLRLYLFNQIVMDYEGPFGYGTGRLLYPQFGIYRNARQTVAKAMFLIDSVTP